MKRIAIIGGGISGLAAAYTIEKKRQSGTPVEYVLFESSPRLGGVLITDRFVSNRETVGCRALRQDRLG